ncbi:hypothetical protein HHK36_010493 [Tetracentron sinense]|uniref:C2 NT-type domain-containing protein n=1 Tax=Tetracentron sinense TaxID=13715 RepID=A0A835DJA3_TETSI|nr:hypothetical protein HHK36_010493 [Tetracentron sinense]
MSNVHLISSIHYAHPYILVLEATTNPWQFLHLKTLRSSHTLIIIFSISLSATTETSIISATPTPLSSLLPFSSSMAGENSTRRNSNTQLLEELEELSQSLYQSHTSTARRTASLALPRTSIPPISSVDAISSAKIEEKSEGRPRSRRMSLSPWRSRPKPDDENEQKDRAKVPGRQELKKLDERSASMDKKGIWSWKPIRALSHIGMQKLSCLFSVEVVTVQGLPASMNGLRLSVCVRKKETKDGAVQTMPARVLQGAADFEETLFLKCHVYCSNTTTGKQLKFEPRPFLIYVFAVDAEELGFGRSSVDLSLLVQESMEKSFEGTRVRQWDTSFNLSGKAKGGELVLKLGFQIMEKDGGLGIYSHADSLRSGKGKDLSSSFGRKQSKSSFSVPSPRMSSRTGTWSPSQAGAAADFHGIDDLNLDEPAPVPSSSPSVQKSEEPESKIEDLDLPEFDVVDKGVEIQDKNEAEALDGRSVSSEVVKEVVHDQVHLTRLTELDSIAQQIKALESMMGDDSPIKTEEETESQRLDAEEETVTREFLQMLEDVDTNEFNLDQFDIPPLRLESADEATEAESKVFLPDLGKGLSSVVQTRNGGYLAAMNPFDIEVSRKETPKLAMQLSRSMILPSQKSMSGFEIFQRMAAIGFEELSSEILSSMPMDELIGKTAEQIAFEGISSAIINGRNKEGASSSAARTIAAVKTMATAMSTGRKERISTGIWNVSEDPMTMDEILAFSMQKIEAMAVEALRIQAEMAEEDAPFDVSPNVGNSVSIGGKDTNRPLSSAIPLEDWLKNGGLDNSDGSPGVPATVTLSVVVQLRDPLRRYEAVGGPVIALVQATKMDTTQSKDDGEERFKVASLHVGGLKVRAGGKRHVWDAEKQRLTAMQWLVAYGLGKAGKKGKHVQSKGQDLLWSISSRIMADMWLKPMRNPDVKQEREDFNRNLECERRSVTMDEILAFSMQKIEAMAVEALRIQAEMAEEDAPFDVSPNVGNSVSIGLDNSDGSPGVPATVTLSVVVQLRDPLRRYEAVGGPVIALVQATKMDTTQSKDDGEERFKVASLHVGGLKVRAGGKRHVWDAEKQRLTAMQWLVAYGLGKAGKKGKHVQSKGQDLLWSISSRIMADMWLKPMRNPDVKFAKQQ